MTDADKKMTVAAAKFEKNFNIMNIKIAESRVQVAEYQARVQRAEERYNQNRCARHY